jgi:hypothetical protein
MSSLLSELTVDWLKSRFLLGVDLTLDDGTDYPESIFEQAIRGGISYVEHELGITLSPFKIKSERHDAYEPMRSGFWPFRLDHRPVQSIDRIEVKFGAFEAAEIPAEWANLVSPEHGQIHLIPSQKGLMSSYRFTNGVPLITGDILQPQRYVPGYFYFDYVSGFPSLSGTVTIPEGEISAEVTFESPLRMKYEIDLTHAVPGHSVFVSERSNDGFVVSGASLHNQDVTVSYKVSTLPSDIKQAIGYKSALLPLDVAGDLIAGAGVASISVGVDGIHQSVNTTASSTNAGYGARVLQYERELKALMPALKSKYKMINVGVI